MAETTFEQVFAGWTEPMAWRKTAPATQKGSGIRISTWQFAGWPGAASAPGGTLNGVALTAPVLGQIDFTDPSAGLLTYGGKAFFYPLVATQYHRFIIADRLWENTISATTTTEQAISAGKGKTVVWPSRDRDGSDLGVGVLVGLEVEVATTNGAANTAATIRYTNTALTTSRVGGVTPPNIPITSPAGTFVPFELQTGDRGISSIEGVTLNTSLSAGTVHLVAYRILGEVGGQIYRGQTAGIVELGMPRYHNGSVPWVMVLPDGAPAAASWEGEFRFTQG